VSAVLDTRSPESRVRDHIRMISWTAGWPARALLLGAIAAYRATLGQAVGGRCRFHPTCSAYAEQAIRHVGAIRGSALAVWRIVRCSPLSRGGVDHPPAGRGRAL